MFMLAGLLFVAWVLFVTRDKDRYRNHTKLPAKVGMLERDSEW